MSNADKVGVTLLAIVVALVCIPIFATLIDFALWSVTGHEPFPWIGHWINEPPTA